MRKEVMWQPQRNMMWPQGQEHSAPPHQPQAAPVHHRGPPYLGYPHIPPGHGPPLLPDPSWTNNDYLLEQQFSQMSFTQPPPPIYHHGHLQYPARPMQNSAHQGQPQQPPRTNSSGIPSLLDIRVPRPVHLHNGYHPRTGPQPQQPRIRNNFPSINTSVPPPRITLLQKPRTQQPQAQSQLSPKIVASSTASSLANAVEEVKVEEPQQVHHQNGQEQEETKAEPELKVTEPELKVKTILKRPASTPSNLALSGEVCAIKVVDNPQENLKKREEEYAKVRLRILGSTGIEENNIS